MTNEQPVILYGVNSPNVVKVAIMLEEVARPYELRFVSVFKGEQLDPAFLTLSPLGKVPAIEDPVLGRPLAESGAILLWLAEHSGKLLPTEPVARSEVMQWLMIQMANVGPMLGQFTHFRLLPPGSQPYGFGRYQEIARRLYRLLDDRLRDRQWLAGDDYSIADVATHPWASYLERHGFDGADYPHMVRWREAIAARPAVARASERMHQAFTPHSQAALQSATAEDLDRFFSRTGDMPTADYSAVTRMR